jgi:hypothetical protein
MDRMKLLDLLDAALSEAELTELSRQLTVSFAAFPGRTKRDRTREFLGYVGRQGRDAGLAEALVALRPDLATPVAHLFAGNEAQLAWLDQVSGGGQTMASGVTLRWPKSGEIAGRPLVLPVAAAPAPEEPSVVSEPPAANPYTPGRRVSDAAMFFGRDGERATLAEALAAGGHVAIVAARSFGASSLLHHVAGQVAEPHLAAVADLKDPAWQTLPGLLNGVWRQWWARVKPGQTVAVGTPAEFATAARKLHAAGFRPLLFLDELEQLVWRPGVFDDALFDLWLELGREGAIGFAATAHVAPAELFAQSGYRTRFYELFRRFDLGLLDGDAARALLTTPVERGGLAVPAGAAEALLAQAGPQPFFLQLAGYYLLAALAGGAFDPAAVTRRFQTAAAPHWQELWDSLSPLAQSHYPAARVGDAGGMAGRQLRLLANRGLVVADGRGFRPFSDGFAAWVGRLRAAGEAAAVALRETTTA